MDFELCECVEDGACDCDEDQDDSCDCDCACEDC